MELSPFRWVILLFVILATVDKIQDPSSSIPSTIFRRSCCSSPLIKCNYFVWPWLILLWQEFVKANCLIVVAHNLRWFVSCLIKNLSIRSLIPNKSIMLHLSVNLTMYKLPNLFRGSGEANTGSWRNLEYFPLSSESSWHAWDSSCLVEILVTLKRIKFESEFHQNT